MEIIRARVLGFCMGVRRAVELASAEAQAASLRRIQSNSISSLAEGRQAVSGSGFSVYTIGPLIHNPKVLDDLKALGVEILGEPPQNPEGCSIIIRAHGISPAVEKELRNSGCRIIDATCPKVKASQLKAQELAGAGYCLFLAGEADHAEIAGIHGYAGEAPFYAIVGNAVEAEKATIELYNTKGQVKTALLGQTTISEEEYHSIGEAVKKYFPNLEIIQTICAATNDRLQALRELLDKVDAVVIAGGKESANTRCLLAAAQESGKPCILAESAADIPEAFTTYNTVGICAGASTPDSVINEIEQRLQHI